MCVLHNHGHEPSGEGKATLAVVNGGRKATPRVVIPTRPKPIGRKVTHRDRGYDPTWDVMREFDKRPKYALANFKRWCATLSLESWRPMGLEDFQVAMLSDHFRGDRNPHHHPEEEWQVHTLGGPRPLPSVCDP